MRKIFIQTADGEDSAESLFEKELRKRGLSGSAVKADDRESEGVCLFTSAVNTKLLPRMQHATRYVRCIPA